MAKKLPNKSPFNKSESQNQVHLQKNIQQEKNILENTLLKHPFFEVLLIISICLLIILIRKNFLAIPYERDEGAYILFGRELLNGKTPYIDFFDTRLPFIFYMYGLVAIFGTSVVATAKFFMVIEIITTVTLFFTIKTLFGKTSAWTGAIAYALLTLNPSINGFTRQSEHLVNLWTVLALYFTFRNYFNKSLIFIFLSGVCFTLAMMIKHNAVFLVIYGGLILLINEYFKEKAFGKPILQSIGVYALGCVSVMAILFGITAIQGATNELFYWAFTHSKIYVSRVAFDMNYFQSIIITILTNYKFFFYSAFVGFIAMLIIPSKVEMKINLTLLIILSILMVFPGNQFYGHYFIMTMPAIAIMISFLFGGIMFGKSKNIEISIRIAGVIFFIFGTFLHLKTMKSFYFSPDYTTIIKTTYGNNPFLESVEIAEKIKPELEEKDHLAVMGSEQEIFLYTNTKPASKHTIAYHLMVDTTISVNPIKWQKEYISEVEKNKPKFFVFYRVGMSFLKTPNSCSKIFDWAGRYLNANYDIYGTVDISPNESQYFWGKDSFKNLKKEEDTILIFKRKNK
jgi:Dolichyl-phosphate-mannose-protein mannosyltransferase